MKVYLYGTRGSLPTPSGKTPLGGGIETDKYGGNTTCIYIQADDGTEHIIDAGTGIRTLGIDLIKNGHNGQEDKDLNMYITHTHWDHIQGLPFFGPAYIPGNKIKIYGDAKINGLKKKKSESTTSRVKSDLEDAIAKSDTKGTGVFTIEGEGIKKVLGRQQEFRNFPVPLEALAGIDKFYDFIPGSRIYDTETLKIDTLAVNHPGGCIAYKFTEIDKKGKTKSFVFCSDFEPDENGYDDELIKFWEGADLVMADAQYEPRDSESGVNPFMKGWGHSDYKTDLIIATKAHVKKLVGTHHEPKMGDDYHKKLEIRAQETAKDIARNMKKKTVDFELAKEGTCYEI